MAPFPLVCAFGLCFRYVLLYLSRRFALERFCAQRHISAYHYMRNHCVHIIS